VLSKTDGRKKEIISFPGAVEGKTALLRITEKYNLCQKLNNLDPSVTDACFPYGLGNCNGGCIGAEPAAEYNLRVAEFISFNSFNGQTMAIIDRGRVVDERSVVLIENGIYKGYGFYKLNYQVNNLDILKNILVPMDDTKDAKSIIRGYIRKKKGLKIVRF